LVVREFSWLRRSVSAVGEVVLLAQLEEEPDHHLGAGFGHAAEEQQLVGYRLNAGISRLQRLGET